MWFVDSCALAFRYGLTSAQRQRNRLSGSKGSYSTRRHHWVTVCCHSPWRRKNKRKNPTQFSASRINLLSTLCPCVAHIIVLIIIFNVSSTNASIDELVTDRVTGSSRARYVNEVTCCCSFPSTPIFIAFPQWPSPKILIGHNYKRMARLSWPEWLVKYENERSSISTITRSGPRVNSLTGQHRKSVLDKRLDRKTANHLFNACNYMLYI